MTHLPKKLKVSILTSGIEHNIDNLIEIQNDYPDLFFIFQLITNKKEIIQRYETRRENEGENSFLFNIQFFLIGFDEMNNQLKKDEKDYYMTISTQILDIIKKHNIDVLILDSFYVILVDPLISDYSGRILNVHPSLLPKFKGKGMFGKNVHKAVIESKEKESGVTVHLVEAEIDSGEILSQKVVKVEEKETPDSLSMKINNIRQYAICDALKILQRRI